MADIRINALPNDAAPNGTDVLPIDGATTRKTTITNAVLAGRPTASQAEAIAGIDPVKAMTPLTVAQAIVGQVGPAYVPNTRTVSVGTGLIGGGVLSSNISIALNSTSTASLALADTSVQPSRTISAGTGLTGGGDLSANRTLAVTPNLASLSALSFSSGDIIFANGASSLQRLPIGTSNQALTVVGGAPSWTSVPGIGDVVGPASSVSGNIPIFSNTTGKLLADAGFSVDQKTVLSKKSANYTAVLSDNNSLIRFSAGATLSLTAAATLGANWHAYISAAAGNIIIDPNGSETINGKLTETIYSGEGALLICDGTSFFTMQVPTVYGIGFSGYTKLPVGLYLQWGVSGTLPGTSPITVTFPIGFPNNCLAITVTPVTAGIATTTMLGYSINSYNGSGFFLEPRFNAGAGVGIATQGFTWMAVGN